MGKTYSFFDDLPKQDFKLIGLRTTQKNPTTRLSYLGTFEMSMSDLVGSELAEKWREEHERKELEKAMAGELIKAENYEVMKHKPEEIADLLSQAAGPEGMSFFDLEKVTVPSGGGIQWQLASVEDASGFTHADHIEGVIIGSQDNRVFWKDEIGAESSPPDCSSSDMTTGVGDPGGSCKLCPMAEFGSAAKKGSKAQACKSRRNLFIIGEDSILPFVLQLPVTSMSEARRYAFRLAGKLIPLYGVVTRLALTTKKTSGGQAYSVVKFTTAGRLTADAQARMRALQASMMPAIVQANQPEEVENAGTKQSS